MQTNANNIYFLAAPDGKNVQIPKELYVAFSDFLKTRKPVGCITIEFHGGNITCVEVMSRKTYKQL